MLVAIVVQNWSTLLLVSTVMSRRPMHHVLEKANAWLHCGAVAAVLWDRLCSSGAYYVRPVNSPVWSKRERTVFSSSFGGCTVGIYLEIRGLLWSRRHLCPLPVKRVW